MARASAACTKRVLVMKSEAIRRPAVGSSDLLGRRRISALESLRKRCLRSCVEIATHSLRVTEIPLLSMDIL